MNTPMKKLQAALFGLAMIVAAGAAHATSVTSYDFDNPYYPVANVYTTNPSRGTASDTYYELALPGSSTGYSSLDFYQYSSSGGYNIPSQNNRYVSVDPTITYDIYQDLNPAADKVSLGSLIGSFTLTDGESYLLTLLSNTQYVLEVALGSDAYETNTRVTLGTAAAPVLSAAVSPVPLPGTALLFGTALLGGIGILRKQRKKA